MKLYRYLSERELEFIKANDVHKIGSVYNDKKYKDVNSHKYKNDVKYLHFYFSEKEISRVKSLGFQGNNICYVCEFEIPFYVIFPYIGVGKYSGHGYKSYLDTVYEVALPAQKMKAKYLKKYEKDKSSEPIDFGPVIKFDKCLFEPIDFEEEKTRTETHFHIEIINQENKNENNIEEGQEL